MTAWAHLPNAALIDEVLASAKTTPEKWRAARGAVWDAARSAAWVAAWDATRDATRDAVWDTAWDAARDAVWGAAAALVAYNDAGQFMKLPTDHLQRLYRIDPHPMFLLLQPAAVVFSPRAMSQGSNDEVPLLQS